MKKLKVGLVGAGYIGMVHLEMLRRIVEAEVVAVADPNRELARRAADKLGIPRIYDNADALLDDPEIEIVHNCAPNNVHFDINRKAILADKEVLSEKPLSLDAKESAELVRLAREKGTLTGIDFCYRYYPVVQEAAARVRRGDLGEVRAFVGHFLQDWLFYDTDYSWRLDPAVAGRANVVADLGSHWCDLLQFVTGLKIVEVMSELHTCIPVRRKPKAGPLSFSTRRDVEAEDVQIRLDDYAALFLRLENGARGNFTTCQVCAGRKVDLELQVFGSKESYAWSHVHPNALWIGRRDRGNEVFYESSALQTSGTARYAALPTGHPMGYHDAVYNLFREFYEAAAAKREGRPFEVAFPDFATGHEEMRIIDAAVESSRTGSWTRV
ncbi:MAG: Gfo/Idh/MocA family oxidoreductase [Candidatus Aminicenantes bacterium]|nr:Gfo/Idh/MocA family oxidoreductase [Candidatus Aminicenantes bacterium]